MNRVVGLFAGLLATTASLFTTIEVHAQALTRVNDGSRVDALEARTAQLQRLQDRRLPIPIIRRTLEAQTAQLQRLQEEFPAELVTLRSRVDALEARTAELQRLQEEFSAELATLRSRIDALEVRTAE